MADLLRKQRVPKMPSFRPKRSNGQQQLKPREAMPLGPRRWILCENEAGQIVWFLFRAIMDVVTRCRSMIQIVST